MTENASCTTIQLTPELPAEVIHYYEHHQGAIDAELCADEEADTDSDATA